MSNPLYLYNTETRKKERLLPGENGVVRMYTCGPTIYNYVHIGNLRTFIFEDILRRAIHYFGMKLIHVMNLTDVDDKTIKGAIEKGITLREFVEPYEKAFFEDLEALNIQRAEHYPLATDYIPDMIEMIEKLLAKGHAYKGKDDSIYFRIDTCKTYGRLSHLCLDELKAGASERVDADEYEKDHIADFVLWKAYDPSRDGQIFWESPFGRGRPGWHIECSAMATKLLGDTLEIHAGGIDNMFPHHENEIAQSECCTDKLFVKLWMHAEHLVVDGKKMSKKLGNFYTLRDLLAKGYKGKEVRYLLLHVHYRSQLNFTMQGLDGARNALRRMHDLILRLESITEGKSLCGSDKVCQKHREAFRNALADDLNISEALAALFDFVREANTLCDEEVVGLDDATLFLHLLKEFDQVLGCIPFSEGHIVPQDVLELLQQRELAREARKWADADECRKRILERGYIIEDTKSGPKLKKSS